MPPPTDKVVRALVESYRSDRRGQRINKRYLPSRREVGKILELCLELLYPGYFGAQDLTYETVTHHVGVRVHMLSKKLSRQVELALCHEDERGKGRPPESRKMEAKDIATRFLSGLAGLRVLLIDDVQAAFDGDPAAAHLDEIILAYPGLLAVTVYRLAHELYLLKVPLLPRMMTEWAHAVTGADIHPGATIGPRFFLDHATGAVIGETTTLGSGARLYQGVTLGALTVAKHQKNAEKRHPTVGDNVTIYANATVLGGRTLIGDDCVVGGGVFLTESVPPGSRVLVKPAELTIASHPKKGSAKKRV